MLNPTPPASRPAGVASSVPPGPQFSSHREIASVQADYLALANDLEQAQALACHLEMQLSGKTNELASFKAICERAQADRTKFEQNIEALRKERHALANQVQRGIALEHKYGRLQKSHEELLAKVERLEAELAGERQAHGETRELLEAGQAAGGAGDLELRRGLVAIREQIDRLLCPPGGLPAGRGAAGSAPPADSHIEIKFSA